MQMDVLMESGLVQLHGLTSNSKTARVWERFLLVDLVQQVMVGLVGLVYSYPV